MTNEEAIEFIKVDISRLWETPQCLEHKKALEMAIKALKQKPETVTEFADRCRECGAKYGKLLKQELQKMREATQEERDGIERYIDSIAEPCKDEKMTNFEQYLEKKAENEPHEVAELICLKCLNRAIHIYPEKTPLKSLQCKCGEVGYLIKTGQTLEEVEDNG